MTDQAPEQSFRPSRVGVGHGAQLTLPCDSVGFLRAVAVAQRFLEDFLVGGALVIAIVGASPRSIVDFPSSLWFVFSRGLAPSRRRLAFRPALLCYPSFYSIALVVEALELAAERFGVLTFVDVHGCCVLQLLRVVARCGFCEPNRAGAQGWFVASTRRPRMPSSAQSAAMALGELKPGT